MSTADKNPGEPVIVHPMDALVAAPDHHTVLLENDQVRVLDTTVGPGERTPIHTHQWPAALYVLSWSDFVRHDEQGNIILDSRTMAKAPPIGAVLWTGSLPPHYVTNVGTADLHVIAVEVKSTPRGE